MTALTNGKTSATKEFWAESLILLHKMKKSLVLGFFDGVHKAHRAVIESVLNCSDEVTLLTFKESPALHFGHKAEYVLSRKDSVNKIKSLGVNEVVELVFSEIADISAENYLENIVNTYKPNFISTGFNHTFGFNKTGNPEFLKKNESKYGYKYICTPPVEVNGEVVSSTLIRNYIKQGKIDYANTLLESNFALEGTVVHGAKLGRTIGFPTANIKYPDNIVKLPFGVYSAMINNKKTVMNWGMKPTVNNTQEPVVEAHILGFDGDLYGQDIRIEVLKQIRCEQKFGSLDELKTQIHEDIKKC